MGLWVYAAKRGSSELGVYGKPGGWEDRSWRLPAATCIWIIVLSALRGGPALVHTVAGCVQGKVGSEKGTEWVAWACVNLRF